MKVPPEVIEDFRNHLYFCFKYLGLGQPTPKQYAMAEELQNGSNDFLLQAGRGDGKSVINACFVSWKLLKDPNRTQLVLSAAGDKAIKFVAQVRQTLSLVPYMQHLIPKSLKRTRLLVSMFMVVPVLVKIYRFQPRVLLPRSQDPMPMTSCVMTSRSLRIQTALPLEKNYGIDAWN